MHPILQALYYEAMERICLPYQTNQSRLLNMVGDLQLKPASSDLFQTLCIHVDESPDFIWPFTTMQDGKFSYILPKGTEGITLPSHMCSSVSYIDMAEFDPAVYSNVWGGRLCVPGAWNDLARSLFFHYKNMDLITQHWLSLDQHPLEGIWDQHHWLATRDDEYKGPIVSYPVKKGSHPRPFTIINLEDAYDWSRNPNGLWQAVSDTPGGYQYIADLTNRQSDKDPLDVLPAFIWPIHCGRQTFGGSVDPLVMEQVMVHGYARKTEPRLILKGQSKKTEFYGIFGPQVSMNEADARSQIEVLNNLLGFSKVIYQGQAMGNCLRRSVEQHVDYMLRTHNEGEIQKIVILTDLTSAIPGTEEGAMRSFAHMQEYGLRLMTSDELAKELREHRVQLSS